MKKLLAIMLALVLVTGVMLPLSALAEGEKEYYVIDGFGGDKESWTTETKIGKYFADKFGIVFHNIPFAGDMTEKMSLWLVGGDYPEMMQIDTAELVNAYIQAEALISYDDYADIMPNFFNVYGESAKDARKVAPDGKMYYFISGASHLAPEPYLTRDTLLMWIVRSDLLEEAGWPSLLTASEWLDFFKTAKANHPENDEGMETYVNLPLGEAWGYNTLFDIGISSFKTNNHVTGYSLLDEVPTVYDVWADNDTQYDFMKFWNDMWRADLIDPESFTDKSDQMVAKAATTQSLAGWYARWMYGGTNNQLVENGLEKYVYVEMPFRNDGDAEEPLYVNYSGVGSTAMAPGFGCKVVTKNAKHPEIIMSFIDFLCTQEGRVINDWGFEGEEYYVDEDGIRHPTEEVIDAYINHSDEDKRWSSYGFNSFAWGYTGSQNRHAFDNQQGTIGYSDEIQALAWHDREIEAVSKTMGGTHPWDVYKSEGSRMAEIGVEYVVMDESWLSAMTIPAESDLIMTNQEIIDYTFSMIPKVIMAESDEEFDRIFAETVEGRKDRGIDDIIDLLQAQVDAAVAEKAAAKAAE